MQRTYEESIKALHHWVHETNRGIIAYGRATAHPTTAEAMRQLLTDIAVADFTKEEYPFYSGALMEIARSLFLYDPDPTGLAIINIAAFGQLYLIDQHLDNEPRNMQFWTNIHPRICRISQSLYADGHFSSAAEKAIKEVETRLREKFIELKPTAKPPASVSGIISALLSENGAFHFTDTSTASGRDYRSGIQELFEGAFSAYRNPSAHANLDCTKREAIEQIMLASQLMYILDKPNLTESTEI